MFDHVGSLKKYDSVLDILRDFFELRMKYYRLRKDWLTGMLEAESSKLTNQARFILEKIQGTLVIGKQLFVFVFCLKKKIKSAFLASVTLCLFLLNCKKNKTVDHICREQAKEGADPNATADGLRLRPGQDLETGSREGEES